MIRDVIMMKRNGNQEIVQSNHVKNIVIIGLMLTIIGAMIVIVFFFTAVSREYVMMWVGMYFGIIIGLAIARIIETRRE